MGISREQALDCFRSDDLVGIGMEADAVRRRLHPEGVVGYAIEGRIDCADQISGLDSVISAIGDAVKRGATTVCLESPVDATQIEALLREIRRSFPALWVQALSAPHLIALAGAWQIGLHETTARLMAAGLNSIADDGINLADRSEFEISEWVSVHRAAHDSEMPTVAGFIFGAGETAEQRVDFLASVHRLQEQTGGFAAFAPRAADAPGGRELDGVTAVERLKTLAIARMFLDDIDNIQAIATPQGLKVLQMGLRFGANDVGPIALEAGREEDIRRIIRDAGFQPAQREMGYRAMMLS